MAKKKPVATAFVLDCSLAASWCFQDEVNGYSEAVESAMFSSTAYVPSLWTLEIANVLLIGERRKRLTEAHTAQFLSLLRSYSIITDDGTGAHAWSATLSLARAQNLTVYDASYLELAMRKDLPLATLDKRLKQAAATVGIPLFAGG